jgi:hypothetical protein
MTPQGERNLLVGQVRRLLVLAQVAILVYCFGCDGRRWEPVVYEHD